MTMILLIHRKILSIGHSEAYYSIKNINSLLYNLGYRSKLYILPNTKNLRWTMDYSKIALTMAIGDRRIAKKILEAMDGREMEEGDIISATGMSPQDLRKVLYILQGENLALQLRTEVNREEGIRRVYWKLNRGIFKEYVERRIKEAMNLLSRHVMDQDSTEHYVCASDPSHMRLPLDEVLRRISSGEEVVCEICGAMLVPENKEDEKYAIEDMIKMMKEALSLIKNSEQL